MNDPTQKIFSNAATPAARSKIAAALLAAGALSTGLPAQAAPLPNNALLTITAGVPDFSTSGTQTNVSAGSWFGMDLSGDSKVQGTEKTALSPGTRGGLVIGITTPRGANHSGAPTTGDTNAITAPWLFNKSTGSDYLTVAATGEPATGINLSGWTVTWNGIPTIPMGTGAWTLLNAAVAGMAASGYANGVGVFSWSGVYGEPYSLDYLATVPIGDASGFGGTQYALHLIGIVTLDPFAQNDNSVTTTGHAVDINVLANDAAPNGINPASVQVVGAPANGTTSVNSSGVVTYTPDPGFGGPGFTNSFTYRFSDNASTPATSNTATVTVAVHTNTPPTAVNDPATVIVGTATAISVLANDTDPDGTTAQGNINPASVTITASPTLGTVSVNTTTGVVTYTAGITAGSDSFQYRVSDTGGVTPDVSNAATVNVTVQPWSGNWLTPVALGDVPILMIESGSYFSMELVENSPQITPISAGADGGVILGAEQVAAGSHSGSPNFTTEVTGIDQPWSFSRATGMHFTTSGGIGVNGDGTLDFTNWRVTWNGISAINMGGAAQDSPVVRGRAAIVCSSAACTDGDTYTLNYMATVPIGDASGFGGTAYGLYLQGHVRFLNKNLASDGTIGSNPIGLSDPDMRLTAAGLANPDPGTTTQCVGDCFDFRVTGLVGAHAKVVLPLRFGIRPNSTYRKFINGTWQPFDTTTLTNGVADTIESAPLMPNSGNCPPPSDTTSYTSGLTAGNRCVRLTIADGGPNDANGTNSAPNGIIDDPSGVAAGAVVTPPKNLATSSSGCSLSADPVSVLKRADWLLLLGFVGWLGLIARRKRAS